jgi:hypothetical protein
MMFRRLWLKRLLVAVIVLGAVPLGGYLGLREHFFSVNERELSEAIAATDALDPGWRWDDIQAARPALPDNQNAVHQVREVTRLLNGSPPWVPTMNSATLGHADYFSSISANRLLAESDLVALREWVEKNEPAIRAARELGCFPNGRFPIELGTNPLRTAFPDIQPWRESLSVLALDAEYLKQQGRTAEALMSLRTMFIACRAFRDEPFLFCQYARAGLVGVATRRLERLLGTAQPTEGLAELSVLLEQVSSDPLIVPGLRGERALLSVLFDRLASGQVPLAELISTLPEGPVRMSRLEWFHYRAKVPSDHAHFLRLTNRMVEATRYPFHEQFIEFAVLGSLAEGNREHLLTRAVMPPFDRVQAASQAMRAGVDCARVAIAIERYRQANQRWPESLEELPTELLPAVPPDPYDGRPLRFRRTGYGAVIYSVGPDRTDDGGDIQGSRAMGLPAPDMGFRLWDPSKRGLPTLGREWISESTGSAVVGISSVLRRPLPYPSAIPVP